MHARARQEELSPSSKKTQHGRERAETRPSAASALQTPVACARTRCDRTFQEAVTDGSTLLLSTEEINSLHIYASGAVSRQESVPSVHAAGNTQKHSKNYAPMYVLSLGANAVADTQAPQNSQIFARSRHVVWSPIVSRASLHPRRGEPHKPFPLSITPSAEF